MKNKFNYCPKCQLNKPLRDFHKCNNRKNKLQLWCKQCGLEVKRKQYKEGRAKDVKILARKDLLKRNYGLTLEEYHQLFINQKGKCAICNKPETQRSCPKGKIDSLRVDHDHKTSKIRGLLCSKCNFGISQFNDDIKLMERAINYLKKQKDSRPFIEIGKGE